MKYLLSLALSISTAWYFAQTSLNVVLFSEDGEPFYFYANGIKQNSVPQTNVRVTGLSPNVSMRIEFSNQSLPVIKHNTYDLALGMEHTFKIKRNKKQEMVIRYFGQTAITEAASNAAIPSVAYNESESNYSQNTSSQAEINSNVQTSNPNDNQVSVNLQLGNIGFQVNVKDKSDKSQTSSNASSAQINTSGTVNQNSGSSQASISGSSSSSSNSQNSQASIPKGKAACSMPMSANAFNQLKNSVEQKPFSDTKMSTAKIATKNNCLSSTQILEICKLFSMDNDKLAYAEFAYDYCTDKSNYYTLSEVFAFSNTQEKFNAFLDAK